MLSTHVKISKTEDGCKIIGWWWAVEERGMVQNCFKTFRIWVKLAMYILVYRVHIMFCILGKGCTVPGDQGTHDKLSQIQLFF